jgi:hypothetical protein
MTYEIWRRLGVDKGIGLLRREIGTLSIFRLWQIREGKLLFIILMVLMELETLLLILLGRQLIIIKSCLDMRRDLV